jgi:hypothetical protein
MKFPSARFVCETTHAPALRGMWSAHEGVIG